MIPLNLCYGPGFLILGPTTYLIFKPEPMDDTPSSQTRSHDTPSFPTRLMPLNVTLLFLPGHKTGITAGTTSIGSGGVKAYD